MKAITQYIIAGVILVLSAFVAVYLFIAFLVIGLAAVCFVSIRRWWRRQHSGNYSSSAQDQPSANITIIEGQFETIEVRPEQMSAPSEPER
jgi:hypothetical protein